jgi:hypothetical protein
MTQVETGASSDGRMSRGEFLTKSALGGAMLVGGSLATGVGSALAAPKPPYLGYRVGDQAADISGPDQYNRAAKLSGLLGSWVLVDLCPWWCGPCKESADRTRAFLDAVNAEGNPQGLTLKLFSVCLQNNNQSPSVQLDAEQWAVAWGFEKRESVIHCAGDPKSNLLTLVTTYGAANGNPAPGYPTYVLVDPSGKIRLYQAFADLDAIEANIAQLSNTTLTSGPWGPIPAPGEILAANLPYDPQLVSGTVAYTLGGGSAVANSVSMPYAGADFSLDDEEEPAEADNFNFALDDPKSVTIDLKLADPTQTIDPNSPIRLSFATQFAHTYQRAGEPSANTGVLVWDQNAYDPNWQQTNPNNPPGLIAYSSQNMATNNTPDGSGFGFPSFRIADLTPSGYYTGLANFVQAIVSFSRTQPYAASNTLQADVNNSATLSAATKASVASSLTGARGKMAQRDFVGAAAAMSAAATTLRSASANNGLQDTADWIAAHVSWLATH